MLWEDLVMLEKKYKILTKKELLKLYGGWGYSLWLEYGWKKTVRQWLKG